MARIARRALRIKELPLLSLGKPWSAVSDASGALILRLYEPAELELARRVLPPVGRGSFGYYESSFPKPGDSGVIAQIEGYRWESDAGQTEPPKEIPAGSLEIPPGSQPHGTGAPEAVLLSLRAERRFRILAVETQEVAAGESPLHVAHVQQLDNGDIARLDSDYWDAKVQGIAAGTRLVAKQQAAVYESVNALRVVSQMPAGVIAISAGPTKTVEGYRMVPIAPSGAVELMNFREWVPGGDTHPTPTEDEVKATLQSISAGSESDVSGQKRSGRKNKGRNRS